MPTPAPLLTTARLILRPVDLSDVEPMQRCFAQWDVVKFLSAEVPWPYPEDGALTFVRDRALPAMAAGAAWYWSIRTHEAPGALIGLISLQDKVGDNRGFWLDPMWWGRGFISEASAAVTSFWFTTLERPVLEVFKAAANTASRRISETSGMRLVATATHDYVCGPLPGEVWRITREEWQARAGPLQVEPRPGAAVAAAEAGDAL